MIKKSRKIITLLALMAIPQHINEGHSPRSEKLENMIALEIAERNRINARYHLIELNENINSVERKKEFLLMRLKEEDIQDSLKENYLKKLNETNEELKGYYSKKDSIYQLIEK